MKVQKEDVSLIHGDLLEEVFAHVSLVDLACAYCVSKTWENAVSSSLLHLKKVKPWLIIHTLCAKNQTDKTTQAYDPRSDTWVDIIQPSLTTTKHVNVSPLRTSNSNLLYRLSYKEFSLSMDPLHLIWSHVTPPRIWRVDPIVAQVGAHIVVAGGVSEFEDDPLSMEMYDMETSQWSTCQSMPYILKDSAASTWLSVAANQNTMYVTEKSSGITCSFSPETKAWSGPFDLRPDPRVFFSAIGFAGDYLILSGIIGHAQNVITLKIWKIKPEMMEFEQIGEIPSELLEKLKGENPILSSISLTAAENFVYIYNSSDPAELIFCELVDGVCKWGSVKNLVFDDERRIRERMVLSCGIVGICDLHMAMKSGSRKFLVKSNVP